MSEMIEVTRDQFLATVGRLDVVLRSEPFHTDWELRNRTRVGRTTPGYRDGGTPNIRKRYFVAEGWA